MKKILITAVALTLAVPALAAQQDIAQLSAVTASREALRTAINTQLSAVQSNFDEIYPILTAGPVYVNTTAPADTKVVWVDTDQNNAIKVRIGEVWTVVGTAGEDSYTLPTAAADTLGGVKVGDRLSIADGVLSADVQTPDISGKEDSLGNPSTNGYVLASTTLGVRSWIEMTGGGTGIAHATSDGNYYASKDGGWASLAGVFLNPSGSADLLTIIDTGTYFTTDTVGSALQELGSELAGVTEITIGTGLTDTEGTLSVTYPVTSESYGSGWSADTEGAQRDDVYAEMELREEKQPSTLNLTTDTSITAQQLLDNRYISNQGASGEVDLTLPAISYSISRTVVITEAQIAEINPPSGEAFDLNGTALTADYCIDSPATVGSKAVFTRMQNASGTWHWSVDTVRGTWADTGATD